MSFLLSGTGLAPNNYWHVGIWNSFVFWCAGFFFYCTYGWSFKILAGIKMHFLDSLSPKTAQNNFRFMTGYTETPLCAGCNPPFFLYVFHMVSLSLFFFLLKDDMISLVPL